MTRYAKSFSHTRGDVPTHTDPRAEFDAIVAGMNDLELMATYRTLDTRVISGRETPGEWEARLLVFDALCARGLEPADPAYDNL